MAAPKPKGKRPRPTRSTRSSVRAALRRLWLRSPERAAALKRDGRTCQVCGVKESRRFLHEESVHVHHLDGIDWDGVIDVILERILQPPERLQTLCGDCHREVHRGGRADD